MKTLTYYTFSLLLIMSVFAACSDDNSTGPDNNNGNDSTDVEAIAVTDNITEDVTWEAGQTYELGGRISVEAGATLTIEGGALIKGQAGSGANATALIIARDATLNANGTADAPIIFTSVADEITPEDIASGNFASPNLDSGQRGLWGGVLVLGNAPISASNDQGDVTELQIEGIPTSDQNGLYGGDDPEDSSGSISYISIRHGGANIGEGNEINGLSLGGVGTGTTIENVEVVGNQDDGVEWFGGTVSVTNVLVWNNGDDAIDTDQAWSGSVDNVVISSPGDSPFELDGPEGSFTSTGHTISNASVYVMGNGSEEMIDVDSDTDVSINNVLFFGLATTEDGAAANIISDDYAEYAANANGYAITSLEVVLPSDLEVGDYFGDLAGATTSVGSVGEATVGADASVFAGWTFASQSVGPVEDGGFPADFGL